VLACDLIVTVFADLPWLRLFGWLSAFAMLAALAADLVTFLHAGSVVNDGPTGTGTVAERLSGWIIPVAKGRGLIMSYRETAHEI
jgi:hypothetical protein